MPRLLRTVARTAVIAGTATAVSNNVSRRQYQRQAEKQAYSDQQAYAEAPPPPQQQVVYAAPPPQQYAAPPPPPPAAAPPAAGNDLVAGLQELATLKDQGILSEEEFAAAKAKLISGG
jgi:hypothetical protein